MFQFNPLLKIAFVSHNDMDEIEENLLSEKSDLKRVDIGGNNLSQVGNIVKVSESIVSTTYSFYYFANLKTSRS